MAENYKTFLKHLVAHPTEDLIKRYGKISKEVYYNENGKMQKWVEYKYQTADGTVGGSAYKADVAYEKYKIKLIEWEIAEPIKNRFDGIN